MSHIDQKPKSPNDKRRQKRAVSAQSNSERDDQGRVGLVLILLALILAFAAYLWPQTPMGRRSGRLGAATDTNSIEQNSLQPLSGHLPSAAIRRINEHLKETQVESDIKLQSTEIENSLAPKVHSVTPNDAEALNENTNPLVLDQVNPSSRVMQDIKGSSPSGSAGSTPDQKISSKLAKERWVQKYEKEYQDEYVRQFKENARKDGLDIRVNKDLDVTGIGETPVERPIRLPQSVSPSDNK